MGALIAVFQNFLDYGEGLKDGETANVTPLFKKGRKQNTGTYGLISLTSILGKMLESIIKEVIAANLEKS